MANDAPPHQAWVQHLLPIVCYEQQLCCTTWQPLMRCCTTVWLTNTQCKLLCKNISRTCACVCYAVVWCLQELLLRSSRPLAALEMRRDLKHWPQALSLAQQLAPGSIAALSKEHAAMLEMVGEHAEARTHYQQVGGNCCHASSANCSCHSCRLQLLVSIAWHAADQVVRICVLADVPVCCLLHSC
jgi:hypothetical protein